MKFNAANVNWYGGQNIQGRRFTCGYCNTLVHSNSGLALVSRGGGAQVGGMFICPECHGPNSFDANLRQVPSPALGNPVNHVPEHLQILYEEARQCSSHGAYTGSVMLLRKMLMTIAVEHGAGEGMTFVKYVDYLLENDLVQKRAKPWVDKIRNIGNDANHKIEPKTKNQAEETLKFVEMILKTNYEFLHGMEAGKDS